MTKTCTKCQVEKPYGEFHKDRSIKSGIRSICKSCEKIRFKKYRDKNINEFHKRDIDYYKRVKKDRINNMISGIYKITNIKTGIFYIGCSTQLVIRFRDHKSTLKHNRHPNGLLQEAYNKHGLDVFKFEVVKEYPANTPFNVLEKEEIKLIWESVQKGKKLYNSSIKNPLTN